MPPGKTLPRYAYRPDVVKSADPDAYISNSLQVVRNIGGMRKRDAKRLKLAIVEHIERSPLEAGGDTVTALREDIKKSPLVQHLCERAAKEVTGASMDVGTLRVRIDEIQPGIFHAESNLEALGLDAGTVNKVLQKTVLGLANLNFRIEEMRNFSAVSGVLEDDALDLRSRLAFLVPEREAAGPETTFDRVVEVAGLLEVALGDRPFIDAEAILRIRETAESVAFREWLKRANKLSDDQIRDMLRGVQARIAGAFQSTAGRVLRFVTSTGLGVANPIAGTVLGALDQFVLDRLVREPGPVAFLNRLYPSVFGTTL